MTATKAKGKRQKAKDLIGICRVCGCTDAEGCLEGCEWTDREHTLCSVCDGLDAVGVIVKRREAIQELEYHHAIALAEIEEVIERAGELAHRIAFVAAGAIANSLPEASA